MAMVTMFLTLAAVAVLVPLSASAGIKPGPPSHDEIHYHTHHDSIAVDGNTVESVGTYDHASAPPYDNSQWDGKTFTTDQPDLAPASQLPSVHFVYLYPSDGRNRFLQFAARLQRDARFASSALHQLFGRGVRLDERQGADGKNYLDITAFRSKNSTKTLSRTGQFSTVISETSRVFKDPNKKYVVWLDGVYPSTSSWCGQAQIASDPQRSTANKSEATSTSVIYRNVNAVGGEFCSGNTILHELSHQMGAVQMQATHHYSGHVNDSSNDLMSNGAGPTPHDPVLGAFYDFGNDDYWDPAADPASGSNAILRWWTVNLSRFICPVSGCGYPNASPGY